VFSGRTRGEGSSQFMVGILPVPTGMRHVW
jgi:hypothetical protein